MSKIVFFSIPAHGHTNPTIEVVRELVDRGNEVLYYSFNDFKDKIERAGARCICCDEYLPKLRPEDEKKIGKDFPALIEMIVDTTISLDKKVCKELKDFSPDCIVSDSLSFGGKLFAQKLNIQYICSTTTFAFNDYTAKMMKPGFNEIMHMTLGMGRINKKIKLLRENGYDVENFISMVKNDNDTNTIVYTSREFQPMTETFSDKYSFVGPSVPKAVVESKERSKKQIYISLGTVNNKNIKFYKNCIKAFENCGMNSVHESLYYGVPMVLFPQHSEQMMVANRVNDLGAGVMLNKNKVKCIKDKVTQVINNNGYKEKANKLAQSFHNAGGAKKAADIILKDIYDSRKIN